MNNKNCTNIDSCNYCDSCNSCYSCDSCDYCNYCDSCYSCYSCDYCNYCNYCDSCYSCDSCNYCDSCNSCYSCDYSYGLRMSEYMLFCLGDGRWESKGEGYQKNYRVFNKQVTKEEYEKISIPRIKLPTATWVDKKDMSKQEKADRPSYKQTGGYLKVLSYKDAWKEWWSNASKEDKQQFLDLPHFDADIFEKITGIDPELETESIEIEGEKYTLNEIKKALNDSTK